MVGKDFKAYFCDRVQDYDSRVNESIKRYTSAGWVLLNISTHHSGGDYGSVYRHLHYVKFNEEASEKLSKF